MRKLYIWVNHYIVVISMQRYSQGYKPRRRYDGISPRTFVYSLLTVAAAGAVFGGLIGANADKFDDIGLRLRNATRDIASNNRQYNGPWVEGYIPDTGMVTSFQNYLTACGINDASNDVLAYQIKGENNVQDVRELLGTYALVPAPCTD